MKIKSHKVVSSALICILLWLPCCLSNRRPDLVYSNTGNSLRTKAFEERKEVNLLSLRQFLPDDVVDAIKDSHGGSIELLPLQARVIEAGILNPARDEFSRNVILEGPTSTGKTDPAFWKALILYYKAKKDAEKSQAALQGRYRSVFFEPSRALCAERARAFSEICERFGIKVRYSNSDYSIDDGNILRGDFDILICTNEKFAYFAQGNRDFLEFLGLVVVDELETLNEGTRGAYLQTVFQLIDYHNNVVCKKKKLAKGPSILGLTIPLDGVDTFAHSLNADVISVSQRPLSIRVGIWRPDDQTFSPFDSNTGRPLEPKRMELGDPRNKKEFLRNLILQCKGNRIMLAVPTRAMVRECCEVLGQLCQEDAAVHDAITTLLGRNAVEGELAGLEDTRNRVLLSNILPFGIGGHEADFRIEERAIVEKLFRNGDISIVVSTATLEKGINVSADAVIFYGWGAGAEQLGTTYGFSYIDNWLKERMVNWVGRAGRIGQPIQSGQQPFAIYIAGCSEIEGRVLEAECERINAVLAGEHGGALHTQLGRGHLEPNILFAAGAIQPFTLREMISFFTTAPTTEDKRDVASLRMRVPMELVYLVNSTEGVSFLNTRRIIYRKLKEANKNYPSQMPRKVVMDKEDTERLLFSMARLCRMEGFSSNAKNLIRPLGRQIRRAVRGAAFRVLFPRFRHEELSRLCKDEIDLIVSSRTRDPKDAKFNKLSPIQDIELNQDLVITMHNLLSVLGRPAATNYFLNAPFDEVMVPIKPRYLRPAQPKAAAFPDKERRFELTPYGKICSSFGVSTATVDRFYSWALSQSTERLEGGYGPIDVLNLLLQTEDGRQMEYLKTGIAELGEEGYSKAMALFARYKDQAPLSTRTPNNTDDLVKLSAMAAWIEGVPFRAEADPSAGIEDLFDIKEGSLDKVSSDFARLCRAFARTCRAISSEYASISPDSGQEVLTERGQVLESTAGELENLADRLQYGLPEDAIPIAKLGVKGLTRGWIMKLVNALPDSNKDLSIAERLGMLDVEGLVKMGIPRGIASELNDALSKGQAAALAQNLREQPYLIPALLLLPQIKESHIEQGRPRISGSRHFTALRVLTRDHNSVVWRRNDTKTREPIELTSEKYDGLVANVACEFLAETAEWVGDRFLADHYFVDFDPRNNYGEQDLKNLVFRAANIMLNLREVAKIRVASTGGSGYHLEAYFVQGVAPKEIEAVKKMLEGILSKALCNPKDVFLKQDPANIEPYVFVDLSPNMKRGVYRNLYSYHSTKGGVKVPVFEIVKGEQRDRLAKIYEDFKSFNAAQATRPEGVITMFYRQLNPAQRQDYVKALANVMSNSERQAETWLAQMERSIPLAALGNLSSAPQMAEQAV